jgi:hypothetical protein
MSVQKLELSTLLNKITTLMKTKFNKMMLLCLLVLSFIAHKTMAQVTVANSTGADGNYTTLKLAFDAINAQSTQAGNNITISITANTTETASAVLNQPTTSSWASLTISPSGGAARTISGAIAAGSPLIDLNGADNVTINGLNSGSNSLTITNTTVSATAGTSTLRFQNDATSNTITNCSINGATTATNMGVIVFGAGIVTGNDNNNINNCNIADASGTFPLNSIVSTGTSAAIDNSGNTLNANNISNYFSATALSSGILLTNLGNSTWTITNNKLFQTATRNYTLLNTHNGISVQTGNGYVITGNTIGYATSTGTGTYTMTGIGRFIGINLGVGTTTATSVQSNTITAISLTTSSTVLVNANGVLCGINVTGGNVNIGTVTGNTIGGSTGTGLLSVLCTLSRGAIVGIHTSSTGNVDIRNNIMGGLSSTGNAAAIAGGLAGIRCSAVAGTVAGLTITNNTIGNTTANNMVAGISGVTTGTSGVSGIEIVNNIIVVAPITISNNIIQNLASFARGVSSFIRGVMTATGGTNSTYLVTGNTITKLTTASTLVGITNGGAAQGIYCGTGTNNVISQNTVSNISTTNTGTTNIVAAGITCADSDNSTITRNRIYNIANAGTSTTTVPAVAAGIALLSGGTTGTPINVANNMISLGNAQTTNTAFIGIWAHHSSGVDPVDSICSNSVNIEGTAASGAQPSFGFYRGDFSATAITAKVFVRNNIFTNTRSGGTGKHYAISNNYGATASITGWLANFNILNANVATIGYWTSDQTFAAWQTSSVGDDDSQSGVSIDYLNTATGDLHINTSIPTTIEGVGTPLTSVTEDFDGEIRAGLTPVDIGADAANFILNDIFAPIISYKPLINNCNAGGSRMLTATIKDATGVPTSGAGLPVLYWRINAGAYTASQGTFVSSNTYTFSLGAGSIIGDVVSYYIVAQDLVGTPNIGIFPKAGAAGLSGNPPAATTPPTTPSSYANVVGGLVGTYTVGVGQTYTTLTEAVADYNSKCVSGAVVFSLTDANYSGETFPITINANVGASAVNTLTIKPAIGVNAAIYGNTAGTLIRLNGAQFVTIDGSNTVGGSTRNLTITNTNTTSPSAISIVSLGVGAGTSNSTISNCNISTGAVASGTTYGIAIGGSTVGTSGADNDNITIQNNAITVATVGIYASGTTSVSIGGLDNLSVVGNSVTTVNTSSGTIGIKVANALNSAITSNTISVETNAPSAPVGISLETGFVSSTVTRNTISKVLTTDAGGYGGRGITIGTETAASNLTVANNVIYGVNGSNYDIFSNSSSIGIAIGIIGGSTTLTTTTGGVNLYYNSVNMAGTYTRTTACITTAMYVGSGASALDIRNNILVNSLNNTDAGIGVGSKNYAIYSDATNTAFTNINNNDYFVSGTQGVLGFLTSDRANLTDIVAGFGQNANSVNMDPVFTSPTNLRSKSDLLDNKGVFIASITTDILGNIRSTTIPDMGAYEVLATIINFTPKSGGVDTQVTITGTNFIGATAVTIGGVAASSFTVVNATTIIAVVNNGFVTGLVTVTNGGTATSAALVIPNFTRTSCANTITALVATASTDANGFAGFDVTWNLGVATYTQINVFYQPQTGAGSTFFVRKTFAGNATGGRLWTVNGNGEMYNIYLQGVCNGNAERINTTAMTIAASAGTNKPCSIIPLPPTPLVVSGNSITFTWNTVPNAYLYQPLYQECDAAGNRVAGGGQTGTAYLTPNAHPNTQSWTVSQLKPNTFYRFSVRVHCLQGNADLISPYTLYPFIQTGAAITVCLAPSPTLGTAGTTNGYASQVINWAAVPSAANGYGINFRESTQPSWTTYHLGNVTSYTISGLKQGSTYIYNVYGACSNGQAPKSADSTFTTGTGHTYNCNPATTNASTTFSNPVGARLNWTSTPAGQQVGKLYGVVYKDNAMPNVQNVVYTDSTKISLFVGTHAGIAANKTYTYSLQTYCDGRLQWVTNTGTFTTPASSASKNQDLATPNVQGIEDLQVYPNPANAEVTLSLNSLTGGVAVELVILDMLGREVYKTNNFGGNLTLDTKAFASGTYLVKVNEGGKVRTRKLVVQ